MDPFKSTVDNCTGVRACINCTRQTICHSDFCASLPFLLNLFHPNALAKLFPELAFHFPRRGGVQPCPQLRKKSARGAELRAPNLTARKGITLVKPKTCGF